MADDYELTIIIRAIDEASAVLNAVAQEIQEDFSAIASEANTVEAAMEQGLGPAPAILSEFSQAADEAAASLSRSADAVGTLDSQLTSFQESAAGAIEELQTLSAAQLSDRSVTGGSDQAPLLPELGAGADLAAAEGAASDGVAGELVSVSRQQLDVMGQLLDVTRSRQGANQVVLNNTFNGILDPIAIRELVIPELERAFTRGWTLLT